MEIRNRLLLVLMALSLMFVYDFFANGRTVTGTFTSGIVRSIPADTDGWGITDGAPFLRKEGSEQYSAQEITSLVVSGTGDFEVAPSGSREITLDYDIRTYGISSMHVQEFHDAVEVSVVRRGERLEISLETPEPSDDVDGARVHYELQVPDGLAIRLVSEFGDINVHDVVGELDAQVRRGSVRVGDHRGAVTAKVERGDVWLTEIDGDVTLEHRRGRVEAVEIGGIFDFDGSRSTLTLDRAQGEVRTHIDRGAAAFYSSAGPLHVSASMARVSVNSSTGAVKIGGSLSPIEVEDHRGPIDVTSDRGHVALSLADSFAWEFDFDVRNGSIQNEFPQSSASRNGRGGRESAETASEEDGSLPVIVRVTGGNVRAEPL